jgi:hypothetical protein
MSLDLGHLSDVMEGTDEGFEVAYFEMRVRRPSNASVQGALLNAARFARSLGVDGKTVASYLPRRHAVSAG